MSTEEEVGYEDAIRQVTRLLQRRHKSLLEDGRDLAGYVDGETERRWRLAEVSHLLELINALHR